MSDITTLALYVASVKQQVQYIKPASWSVGGGQVQWYSLFDKAGMPGAGVLAGTSVAAGVVPTDATAGCPVINAFGASATGRLTRVEFAGAATCRFALFDMLWKGGAYAFNASQALAAQPSYSSRVPGTDYTGLELWVEQVTTGTGVQSVNVTYNDEGGASGSTGTIACGTVAGAVGRCFQLPLATGDNGVQLVTNVVGSVASAGTFNVLVLRPLWTGRVTVTNDVYVHDLLQTGMPRVYDDSALYLTIIADAGASGGFELMFEIANG